jgi:galactofuranosylgalactofuranosylrhamnosyl-N-acetylglucosaminyl-diphospho-decaprenol beta-1,5/1,6-galactofuranosyltransferase
MNIIGRIRLPIDADRAELYVRSGGELQLDADASLPVVSGNTLSFNTYFNSLYESFYTRYTTLTSVYYLLQLEGSFSIAGYREREGGGDRELLFQREYRDCHFTQPTRIDLDGFAQTPHPGRIYLELTSLGEGAVREGWLATDQPAEREVCLGIISCTYKKEAYIQKTVNALLNDPLLQDQSFQIFVVDNGRTLDDATFGDRRVRLLPNRNVGGSGGFTRGLVEALKEPSYSHFLFMDDDVEVDSEVIFKLFSIYQYARTEFAISGAMLDLNQKYLLFEAGAHYASHRLRQGFNPFEIASLKTEVDLRQAEHLNTLLQEEPIDYGAFWFFAFPRSFVEAIGLPLPFFIKGDDIEFGLRISRQLQQKIVAFPAIAVWHEPFYLKFPVWDTYYYFRNILVTHAIHGSLSYLKAVKDITVRLVYTLLFFDYNSAGMLLRAFEDYVQGPEFIRNSDPEKLHSDIIRLSKIHNNQSVDYNFEPPAKVNVPKAGLLRRLASLVTLNGHFLPGFLLSNQDAFVWLSPDNPGQRSRAFAKKRVLLFKEQASCLYKYEMDKQAGVNLLFTWFRLVISNWFRWNAVNSAWKNAASEFVSVVFWQRYLQLKE